MFLIITFSFFLIRLAPGGPFSSEKKVTEEVMQNLLKKYHMDEPLYKQYFRYLGDICRGDLGPSFKNKDFTVNELIFQSLPNSITLGCIALASALILGVLVGTVSALKQNSWIDYASMSVATVGISVPTFVVGPVIMLLFAMKLGWLPTSGWITGRNADVRTIIM
ncbi:MAG: ABC transporter permease subunit, partial [Treponemataceae bacterium]|nr:ABC transporter permease subunit [Treponemataceae bacterium]